MLGALIWLPEGTLEYTLSPAILFGLLGMGSVYVLGNSLYFSALAKSQLSEIDLLLRSSSLWTLVIGIALLGESTAPRTLLGSALIITSVLSLAHGKRLTFNRPQVLALAAALSFGLGNVVDKALSPFFDVLTYTTLNLLLTGVGMLGVARANPQELRTPTLWTLPAWLVASTFALTQAFIILAFQAGGSAGQVILVAQVRLLILMTVGIALMNEKDRLPRKVIAAGLMIAGMVSLYAAP
jgi:drug/metabolite transporter (DMT)-like permease